MHIVTIDNFLVCCSLEVGGSVIGWIGTVLSVLGVISTVAILVFLSVSFEEIQNALNVAELDADSEWVRDVLKSSQICEYQVEAQFMK
jgi:hypothetical protein